MVVHQWSLLDSLRHVGALREGHFLLASGKHSNRYIEKFDLFRRPAETEIVCHELADRLRQYVPIDVVVGPTTGGMILAFEVARQLGLRAAYAERREDGLPGREFRRGTTFERGERVVVVDDILTTGKSIREPLDALKPFPVEIAAVAVLVDRSGGREEFGVPLITLETLDIATWDAKNCPLCAKGIPLVKPGTSKIDR